MLHDILQLNYNNLDDLQQITKRTACVVAETIQAEAGVNVPDKAWMAALRKRCTETGTLLVLDEIQCGFGRNGSVFAFEQFNIVPDILLLGKALGGGMPLGAFVADKSIMNALTHDPVLGHINTFGGHPVSCAAGLAAFKVLLEEKIVEQVTAKERLFLQLLKHPRIKNINSYGLMIAVEFADFDTNKHVIDALIAATTGTAVFTDWFLFAAHALRIAPPLTITENEITTACEQIIAVLDSLP